MNRPTRQASVIAILLFFLLAWAPASMVAKEKGSANATTPGKLVADPPSFECASFRWFISGDADYDCGVRLKFRKTGAEAWEDAHPMLRVRFPALQKGDGKIRRWRKRKKNANLLAGSIFHLKPGTSYDVKLDLTDPDGGKESKTLTIRTRALPRITSEANVIEASKETIKEKLKVLKAGDRVILKKGNYGNLSISGKGTAEKPIVLEGETRDGVIINGTIALAGQYVWIRNLTIKSPRYGVHTEKCPYAIVSECHITAAIYGVFIRSPGAIITDNVIKGPCTWPRSKGIERPHGIETRGAHIIIAHNRVSGFGDGISNSNYYECVNWEVCYNDVSECTDDGIEVDFCSQNARIYRNRWTNVYNVISLAPTWGGPAYVLRNEMYNVNKAYKTQRHPTGCFIFNNTSYSFGYGLHSPSAERWFYCKLRNNLLLGRKGKSFEVTPGTVGVDVDYNGHSYPTDGKPFGKWNGNNYPTLGALQKKGVFKNAMMVKPDVWKKFSPIKDHTKMLEPASVDYSLKEDASVIDKGQSIVNIIGNFTGKSPDLGAREFGHPAPHFGPREKPYVIEKPKTASANEDTGGSK